MRVTAELQLPTDLGTLRSFVAEATDLLKADMTSYVTEDKGWLKVCSVRDLD